MTALDSLARVLGAPVRVEDARVGHVAGVVGDSGFARVIGLDVWGSDGSRKFLPWVAATLVGGVVSATSRLVLFETAEIEAYARRGAVTVRSTSELSGLAVSSDGAVAPGGDRVSVSARRPAGTTTE